MGQNMVGVVRLSVSAPAGTGITLHHAEMLNPDGTVYTINLRKAVSVDTYTCKGGGTEIWQPKFTFHGFRFRVLRRERNRITALRIVPLPREAETAGGAEKKPKAGTAF